MGRNTDGETEDKRIRIIFIKFDVFKLQFI